MINLTRRQFVLAGLCTAGSVCFEMPPLRLDGQLSQAPYLPSQKILKVSVNPHLLYFFNGEQQLRQDLNHLLAQAPVGDVELRILSSAELRRIHPGRFCALGGQPFGPCVEQRIHERGKNQEDAARAAAGSDFDLVYLGSFNNSYGRLCQGDGNFAKSLVGASGLHSELFKSLGFAVHSEATKAPVNLPFITDAYPHFYHLLKSPLAQFDRYLLDDITRSAEAMYLVVPRKAWLQEGASAQESFKKTAEDLAHKYTSTQLRRENAYVEQIRKVLSVERVHLPESTYAQYCYVRDSARARPA